MFGAAPVNRNVTAYAAAAGSFMIAEKDKERFPKNVSGTFYVANGECITCMAPEHAAPELMGFDGEARHCYFKKTAFNT